MRHVRSVSIALALVAGASGYSEGQASAKKPPARAGSAGPRRFVPTAPDRVARDVSNCAAHSLVEAVQDSAYWRIFWENSQACDKKVGELPAVDFLKHDVLLVLFGRAPHTGYFASLDSVVERRNLTMAFVSYRTDGCEVGFAAHFMNYGTVVPKWGKPIAWTIRVNDPPSWCRSGARR